MSVAVRVAISSKLAADATLTNLLSDPAAIYHDVAPPEAELPFVVFNKQSGVPRYTHRTRAFDNELWTIKAVARKSADADAIATRIDAILSDGTLSISGKTFMSCRREADVEYTETDSDQIYRHAGAMYRLRYQG